LRPDKQSLVRATTPWNFGDANIGLFPASSQQKNGQIFVEV